jgi:hypothetical protein
MSTESLDRDERGTELRVEKIKDSTERIVEFAVTGADTHRYSEWLTRPHLYRPDTVQLIFRDGELQWIKTSGPRVKVDGSDGHGRAGRSYRPGGPDLPQWLADLAAREQAGGAA